MNPDIRIMSENFGGLEWKDVTNIHPLGLAVVLILGLVMLFVARRWAILPMLIIACFISAVQKITILSLDFNLLRIMVFFGICRLFLKKEYLSFIWKPLDIAIVLWALSSMLILTLQQGDFSTFINRLGFAFDVFGMYFLFRCLIQDWMDVDCIVKSIIWISIPVMAAFLLENRTGHNMFSVFGGVPAITVVREDRLRCQGAFSNPIIAGCFWASLMPMFAAIWWKSAEDKIFAITGLITSFVIVVCCSSSTPLMGVISGLIGGLFFLLRRQMRIVRWAVLLTLIALHMVMKAPVWHLISRVSAVGGSTSYFRYALINGAIQHFSEWALLGTKSTAHWFWGAQDVCNQYVLEGVEGGFVTLCLFVVVIAIAFREVGRLWRLQIRNSYKLALSWALGVSLFVHCTNFIGVSYFDQIWILWYLLLAIIGSLSIQVRPLSTPKIRSSSTILKNKPHQNLPFYGAGKDVS
jgi:hypothetical protein